jgi:DNA polymerase sigma
VLVQIGIMLIGGGSGGMQQVEVAVLRYGSDPLKTYLPESDVDITVIVNEAGQEHRSALTLLKM